MESEGLKEKQEESQPKVIRSENEGSHCSTMMGPKDHVSF